MDPVRLLLLFDFYGELLTERQRMCFDLRYNQDLSFGEIAEELGISRQGVFDNITRAEARMIKMEEKTGCVRRSLQSRRAVQIIGQYASALAEHSDSAVQEAARHILEAAHSIEE